MSERLKRPGPAWPALIGLALLALAQTRFEIQRVTPLIGLAALAGLGAWAWAVRISPQPPDRLGALDDRGRPGTNRQLGGLAAAGLALGGWFSLLCASRRVGVMGYQLSAVSCQGRRSGFPPRSHRQAAAESISKR
ncbi:MAG TPA: hypothetical protein VGE07_16035 [Herpetosiphonaceae bacterium]